MRTSAGSLVPNNASQAERSPEPNDSRITWSCLNLPASLRSSSDVLKRGGHLNKCPVHWARSGRRPSYPLSCGPHIMLRLIVDDCWLRCHVQMRVSWKGSTPKPSTFMGFFLKNHPFGGPPWPWKPPTVAQAFSEPCDCTMRRTCQKN